MSVPHYAPSIKSLAIKAFGSFSYAIGFPPKEAALYAATFGCFSCRSEQAERKSEAR
jgi:hypothetical protein